MAQVGYEVLGFNANPFNSNTLIRFELQQTELVGMMIFDIQGRIIRTLIDEILPGGLHQVGGGDAVLCRGTGVDAGHRLRVHDLHDQSAFSSRSERHHETSAFVWPQSSP